MGASREWSHVSPKKWIAASRQIYPGITLSAVDPGECLDATLESTRGLSNNLGWSSGRAKDTAANGATTWTGKFLSVSRKVNGKWLYIRDTWNRDGPPQAAGHPQ